MQKQEIPPSTRCHSDFDLALNQLAALQAISGASPWRPCECPASVLRASGSTLCAAATWWVAAAAVGANSAAISRCANQRAAGVTSCFHTGRPAQKRLLCCSCVVRKVSLHSMTTRSRSRTVLCRLFSSLDLFGAALGRQQVWLLQSSKCDSLPRPESGIKEKILWDWYFPLFLMCEEDAKREVIPKAISKCSACQFSACLIRFKKSKSVAVNISVHTTTTTMTTNTTITTTNKDKLKLWNFSLKNKYTRLLVMDVWHCWTLMSTLLKSTPGDFIGFHWKPVVLFQVTWFHCPDIQC